MLRQVVNKNCQYFRSHCQNGNRNWMWNEVAVVDWFDIYSNTAKAMEYIHKMFS